MAASIDPGSDSTAIQTAQPGTRSVHHRPHEQKVYRISITIKPYETLMRKNLDDSRDKFRQQLGQHLKDKLQNVSDRIIDGRVVANILDPDRNVELVSNLYSDVSYDDICREYKTGYKKFKEYKFLLIIAPTKTDSQLREMQSEELCSGIENKDSIVTREVATRAELEAEIKKFIVSTAKDVLHAYIVFNGHGGSDGLALNGEERCYNLDDIIRFVEKCFDAIDVHNPFHLPAKVFIAFGQCYGHLHDSSVNNSRFEVRSFTNPDKCETQNLNVYNSNKTEIISSNHLQLEEFVQDIMKFHGPRGVGTDEPNCLTSSGVPPLSHMVSEYSSRLDITSSDQMELSDSGISISSSNASFLAVTDSGIENMEIEKDITKRKGSKFNSRRQQKNP